MLLVAICSSASCGRAIQLQDMVAETSIPTPAVCPDCGADMISRCLACKSVLVSPPSSSPTECNVCHEDIRASWRRFYIGATRRGS
jgi:predicted RNA-binding Zn-ribbon protein involved in translation (DUF1610 family)